jgi:hypothetical protein
LGRGDTRTGSKRGKSSTGFVVVEVLRLALARGPKAPVRGRRAPTVGCTRSGTGSQVQGCSSMSTKPSSFRGAGRPRPFGGGRRRCLGAAFAMLEMRIGLRAVLRQGAIEPVGNGAGGVAPPSDHYQPARRRSRAARRPSAGRGHRVMSIGTMNAAAAATTTVRAVRTRNMLERRRARRRARARVSSRLMLAVSLDFVTTAQRSRRAGDR